MIPEKLDPVKREAKVYNRDGQLKIRVEFDSVTFQPHFYNSENKLVELNYTITSYKVSKKKGCLNVWTLESKQVKPEAIIFHLHGNAGNLLYQFGAMDKLVEKGFKIFLFDYSGFGFSTGKATQKQILSDAQTVFNFIDNSNNKEHLPIIVYGQSLGGHLAVEFARINQSKIDGIAVEGAFSSHRDIASYTMKKALHLGFLGRLFVSSRYQAKKSVTHLKKPVLVIHSAHDETIPLFMGKRIYEHANQPKEFYGIDGCHICGPSLYTDSIAVRLFNLLKLKK